MVGGHDDERVVVQPDPAQALQQIAEEGVDELHLQQMSLVIPGDGQAVVPPAVANRPDDVRAQRMPLSRRQMDPRLVRQERVQEVESRAAVGAGRIDRGDEVGDGPAAIACPAHLPPVGEAVLRREVPPALRHRRQPGREVVGQHGVQVDDREVAQDRGVPGGCRRAFGGAERSGHRSVSGSATCRS